MSSQFSSHLKLAIVFGLLVGIVDLVLKSLIHEQVLNTGGVWGIGVSSTVVTLLHIIVMVLICVTLIWASTTRSQPDHNLVLVTFAGVTSISNLFDRIMLGGVRDYIQILGWWLNIADIVVTSVIMLVIINYIYAEIRSNKTKLL